MLCEKHKTQDHRGELLLLSGDAVHNLLDDRVEEPQQRGLFQIEIVKPTHIDSGGNDEYQAVHQFFSACTHNVRCHHERGNFDQNRRAQQPFELAMGPHPLVHQFHDPGYHDRRRQAQAAAYQDERAARRRDRVERVIRRVDEQEL